MAENNFDELTAKLLSSNIETSTKVTESELEEFRNRLVEKEKRSIYFHQQTKVTSPLSTLIFRTTQRMILSKNV